MILQHPKTKVKQVVRRRNQLAISWLKQEGYVDITPQRTPAQQTNSKRWQKIGTISRLSACLVSFIHSNQDSYSKEQLTKLMEAVVILRSALPPTKQASDPP